MINKFTVVTINIRRGRNSLVLRRVSFVGGQDVTGISEPDLLIIFM